jgi:PleD family two-component response regulator
MKTHILLIGEEKSELEMFEQAFQQIQGDIDYRYATESVHALETIRKNRPDIIFINYNAEPFNSLQLLSIVKSEPKLRTIRVFLYATVISEGVSKMARTLGASGCIEKTDCPATFLRELKAILDPQLLPAYIFLGHLNNPPNTVMAGD